MSHRFETAVLPRGSVTLPPLELWLGTEKRPDGLGGERETWAVYTVEYGKRDMWLGDFALRMHAEAFVQMLYENDKR